MLKAISFATLGWLVLVLGACQGTTVPRPGDSTRRDAPARPDSAPEPDRLLERIWWNQEQVVEVLNLEPRQRREMDVLFGDFLSRREALRERRQGAAQSYYAALESGNWEGAREALRRMESAAASLTSAQPLMKIDVLELLTVEQRARFQESYPNLYRRPWLRRMRMGSQPADRGAGPR